MRVAALLAGLLLVGASCSNYERNARRQGDATVYFDLQGHRGARGLAPENTLPAFWKGLSLDITTVELDLAVTRDGQLIVSHEPWMSPAICLDSTGQELSPEVRYNIHEMTYKEVLQFDCGTKQNPRFPEQETTAAFKPRLLDVIRAVEDFVSQKNRFPVHYNIEIKSRIESENIYHPPPAEFATMAMEVISKLLPTERFTLQSFDVRVLQFLNKAFPDVKLVYLVGSHPYDLEGYPYTGDSGLELNLELLGFTPDVYSPYFQLLDPLVISQAHDRGMLVIPWTVNEATDMKRLFDWGVDGIITDYPNRFWESGVERDRVIRFEE